MSYLSNEDTQTTYAFKVINYSSKKRTVLLPDIKCNFMKEKKYNNDGRVCLQFAY